MMTELANGLQSPEEKTLADYVMENARQFGAKPAIEFLGTTISYRELDRFSNRMANLLREQGVGKGDVVGIHMPNTPQYLITLVAASKLGAAATGVSPLLTSSEMLHQVTDAQVKVLVTLNVLFNDAVAPIGGKAGCLKAVFVFGPIDCLPLWKKQLAVVSRKLPRVALKKMEATQVINGWKRLGKASTKAVQMPMNFSDTVFIQYTGGTTGKPKGAELSLRAVQAETAQLRSIISCEEGKETLASAFPYFHTAGLILGVIALKHAARILVVPDPRDTERFCKMMLRYPPTLLANVPTLYQMLLEEPTFARVNFKRLNIAVSGAAPFAPELIKQLEGVIGQGKLCEGFGMTETCGVSVINPPGKAKIGSVGLPLPGVEVRIVDVDTGIHELVAGEPGEIIIQGEQAMTGYLNSPEASAKTLRKFEGRSWVYTGDIGVMDDDGYLSICDRAKDMLIVGGYKVFSVEVESKLAELEAIELCAVIGSPDTKRPGNEIVNLFVQLKALYRSDDESSIRKEILDFCRQHMSAYKVLKIVHFHDALPLTAVGKLDKKALRPLVQDIH